MGKWMLILAWAAGLGLLTLLFHKQLAQQLNPNSSPKSQIRGERIEVQLQQNRYGHYVTSGLINAQPVVFMLDTGATNVQRRFAKQSHQFVTHQCWFEQRVSVHWPFAPMLAGRALSQVKAQVRWELTHL